MAPRTSRLEWISLLYLLFFVLAVLSPSIYTRGYLGLSETTLEELTIFLFGVAGLLTFTLYERLMERRDREREQAQSDFQKAQRELIESYAYIGSINRKIELLKKLASETSLNLMDGKRLPKEIFHALASNACAAVGAEAALIRFVELPKLRTEREFAHEPQTRFVFRVPNRDLRALHEQSLSHGFVVSEDQRQILVVPSDRANGDYRAYLLIHLGNGSIPEVDTTILKVFVNQAEMLYRNFAGSTELVASSS